MLSVFIPFACARKQRDHGLIQVKRMSLIDVECAHSWYVLNYIGTGTRSRAEKTVERFNIANDTALEIFAPTYVVRQERKGETKFRTVSLTFHYVFVKGPFDEVKRLCGQPNGFSFLIDHGSDDRYAIIDDRRMAHFKNIARAYKNCLPYFPLDDIDLEDGDLVEVVKGDFPGLVGHYMPNAKSKTGNIVLNIYNKVGTIAFDINATDVRVLEFSSRATRANDQIDAFVPRLLKALRFYAADEALPLALAAKLSVFTGRMGIARLQNRKLDAKLQLLLYAANRLIGDTAESSKALTRFVKLQDTVTNDWTKGLINLILAILTKDSERLEASYATLSQLPADSRSKTDLLTEYQHYLCPQPSLR